MTERVLPLEMQLVSLALLCAFSGWVVWLIRRQRLHLRESLAWLLSTLGAIALIAYPDLLVHIASLLKFKAASNALFGAGLLYLAVNVLAVTISASTNASRVRRLAQECALLRAELDSLRAGRESARPGDAPDAGEHEPERRAAQRR